MNPEDTRRPAEPHEPESAPPRTEIAAGGRTATPSATAQDRSLSRRALLRRAGATAVAGAAAAAGATLAASPVAAADVPLYRGVENPDAQNTRFVGPGSASDDVILHLVNTGTGSALSTESLAGDAILANAVAGHAVHAVKDDSFGGSAPPGHAVLGEHNDHRSSYAAVAGVTVGSGPGVYGLASGTGHGVWGSATASGAAGVAGTNAKGRGGVFDGGRAQVRLIPSTASSHPRAGLRGDLFVDKTGRLWYCRGGTSWKQLA